MKLNNLLYLFVGALILINVYFNLKNRELKKDHQSKEIEMQVTNRLIHRLVSGIAAFYQMNSESSERGYILLDKNFREQFQTGEKIICLMQQGVCGACIFRILQDLSILEEKIGTGHVMVMTTIGTKDHPFEIQEFDFPTFYVDTLFLPKELSKEPIVFVADSQLNIKFFYLPELLPQLRRQYFGEILLNYFNNNG